MTCQINAYNFFFSIPMFVILGLFIGSFINVIVHCLPRKMEREWLSEARETLEIMEPAVVLEHGVVTGSMAGRSACPACQSQIKTVFLTTVLGWFFTNGSCANCGVRISKRYPIVEFLVSVIFGLVAYKIGPHPVVLAWAVFSVALITLALIDADTMILPDVIVLPLMWFGILLAVTGLTHVSLENSVIGAAGGYLVLWIVAGGFRLLTGKDGMGNGDMKLLAVAGAWLGWMALIDVVLASSLAGAAFGLYQRFNSKLIKDDAYPFGPFLVCSILMVAYINYSIHK